MIPTNNEKYELKLIKRKENSAYEYEKAPCCTFKGRPANQIEKKNFRIIKGVNGGTDSTFVYATNLPEVVNVNDQVIFLDKVWTIMSVGYYFDAALFVNPSCLNEEQIIKRCPKGINIQ